jgi:hypothetical protein
MRKLQKHMTVKNTLKLSEDLYRGSRVRPGIDLVSLMEKLDMTHPLDTVRDVMYA